MQMMMMMAWLYCCIIIHFTRTAAFLTMDYGYSMQVDELYPSDDDLIIFFNPSTPESSDHCDQSTNCTLSKSRLTETSWPVFPVFTQMGLGIYGNDVDRCDNHHCDASIMVKYLNHASGKGIRLDYTAEESYYNATIYMNYRGSFAHKKTVCSKSGRNCAIVLQLNNRPDYAVRLTKGSTIWHITTAFDWLTKELYNIPDPTMPIFINVHQLSLGSYLKIMDMFREMVFRNHKMLNLRVFLIVSHDGYLKVIQKCIVGNYVPIVHVTTIFNNWYTAVKILPDRNDSVPILLLSSMGSTFDAGNTVNVIDFIEAKTSAC